jgi:hypothetical protein
VSGRQERKGRGAPLGEGHDGGALVLEDGFVRVHANDELVAEAAGLQRGAGMAFEGCQLLF